MTEVARRLIVVPSRTEDVYRMAKMLRAEDRQEILALGVDPRSAIRSNYRDAILRKTYFVDGEIAAMTGLCGGWVSQIGHPYLVTTPAAAKMPVAFIKCARNAVGEMLARRERLGGYVLASYESACRMLEMIGFNLADPAPLGPRGVLFRQFTAERAR
jgi:hypothetical protein